MSLGERIKEQRKSSGLSQEKVAEFVGVSRPSSNKVGNRSIRPKHRESFQAGRDIRHDSRYTVSFR